MSKILEEVARGILASDHDCDAWEDQSPYWVDMYLTNAQAAIDAMGVLILPADAEPMVGDWIEYKDSQLGEVFDIHETYEPKIWVEKNEKPFGVKSRDVTKIIKRGDMLVVQEK